MCIALTILIITMLLAFAFISGVKFSSYMWKRNAHGIYQMNCSNMKVVEWDFFEDYAMDDYVKYLKGEL